MKEKIQRSRDTQRKKHRSFSKVSSIIEGILKADAAAR
jgi:hypothetical protein